MHGNEIKARLAAYRGRWPEESKTVTRFEAFIDSYPDCFERSCPVGHITGSAWIANRTGARVLLTHRRKLGRWLHPGGHSDGNPDTLEVALREAQEESGLEVRSLDEAIFDLDVHLIPARNGEPAHYHYDVRFLVQAMEDRFRVSEESRALAWVPTDRVGVFTNDESVLRMARKWQARRADEELVHGHGTVRNRHEFGPEARDKMEKLNEQDGIRPSPRALPKASGWTANGERASYRPVLALWALGRRMRGGEFLASG